jgi:hypothetical protein
VLVVHITRSYVGDFSFSSENVLDEKEIFPTEPIFDRIKHVLMLTRDKLECLLLSRPFSLAKYLWTRLGAYLSEVH